MLLLIDNYDSFAHNLARYFERLGHSTVTVRNDRINAAEARDLAPSAVVISPGPCTPREAGSAVDIVRTLLADVPILGVCLGHQVIAEALGGRTVRAGQPVHGRASKVLHQGVGIFENIPSPLSVGRYHSLVVERTSLPSALQPTAWTYDGVLMAFQHRQLPVVGVQFHPESILTEHGYNLLANFLKLAGLSSSEDSGKLARDELVPTSLPCSILPTRPVTF